MQAANLTLNEPLLETQNIGSIKIAGAGLLGPWMQYTKQVNVRKSTRDLER